MKLGELRGIGAPRRVHVLVAVACLLTGAGLRWWAAPAFETLSPGYTAETRYVAQLRSRQTPFSPEEISNSIVRRRDQTLTTDGRRSLVQGDAHWLTSAGDVIFETFNIYAVDRRDRRNLAGYGNAERTGQYLFPPHTGKTLYDFWDPIYAGPYVATFDRVDEFRGVEVYVFKSVASGIDETAGYEALPDVPERYRALTYGAGRLWVEPASGVVVDHEDAGASYFIEPATGQRVGSPINIWRARFTPDTIEAQLELAKATRWRTRMLEQWLPLAFAVAGLASLAAGVRASHGGRR